MIKKNQIHPVSRNGTKFNKSQFLQILYPVV